jgi:hypothetical protein
VAELRRRSLSPQVQAVQKGDRCEPHRLVLELRRGISSFLFRALAIRREDR